MKHYLAIDFGGTRTRAGWFAEDMTLIQRAEMLSLVQEPQDTVIQRIVDLAKSVVPTGSRPTAIGISAPGPLDAKQGIIYHAKTLPHWADVPLSSILSQAFDDTPAYMDNDANLGALAEYHRGAGRGANPMIYLTISTGIGGGCVIDGELFTGWKGLAIEPGHMQLTGEDGQVYRWEELASGTGIARWAKNFIEQAQIASPLHDCELLTTEIIGNHAHAGDPLALQIVAKAGQWLGLGLVNLIHLFNPQVIVLGGSVMKLGDLILDPARKTLQSRILSPEMIVPDLLQQATLGDDVCLYGAMLHCYTIISK